MNNNNKEPPYLLPCLATTRPRPRRSHRPSNCSPLVSPSLTPSYDGSNLFDDDQLASFFPASPALPLPHEPSQASSCETNGESIDRVEEAEGGERQEEMEGKQRNEEEDGVGDDIEGKEDGVPASCSLEDEGDDGVFNEDEACGTSTNSKEPQTKDHRNSPLGPSSPCSPPRLLLPPPPLSPPSPAIPNSPLGLSSPLSSFMDSSLPLRPSLAAERHPSSSSSSSNSFSSSYPISPDSISQRRRNTSSSSSSSSAYGAGLALSSPACNTGEEDHETFMFPPKISRLGSIYSNLGLSCSDPDSPSAEGDKNSRRSLQKDLPPGGEEKTDAPGGLHEEIPQGETSPLKEQQTEVRESESDETRKDEERAMPRPSSPSVNTRPRPRIKPRPKGMTGTQVELEQPQSRPNETHAAEDVIESETNVINENQTSRLNLEAEETDGNALIKITDPSPARPKEDTGKEEEGVKAIKKVPPAKPPRLGNKPRKSEAGASSNEDQVQYRTTNKAQDFSLKKSASLDNILESSIEESPEVEGARFTENSAEGFRVSAGILETPLLGSWRRKETTRHIRKLKESKAAVAKLLARKPPVVPHHEHKKLTRHVSSSKIACGDSEALASSSPSASSSSSSSTATTAAAAAATTTTKTEAQAKSGNASLPPNKPPRKFFKDTLSSGSIERTQATCEPHGAALNFYCAKCRVVVCRDCTVVAHSQSLNHKVLDTLDALATLRSEAVALLRHYTILSTMHATLKEIYHKFARQHPEIDTEAIGQRLQEGRYLSEVVKDAENVVSSWTNIFEIRQQLGQWEARQQDWGDIVFLSSRCALLADMHVPSDTVYLKMGNWVMPTPWIQLSHLLQPYLGAGTTSKTSSTTSAITSSSSSSSPSPSSMQPSDKTHRKVLESPSPKPRRSASPFGAASNTGGTDQPFPYNARQVVLSNLVPYIILNPVIRYFVHIEGPREVEVTLVVMPVEEHAEDYLKRRRNNATKSPGLLRRSHYRPQIDAITMVEQQMTSGAVKTRITASAMSVCSSATPAIVKVSFSDVKVVSDGHGLPAAKGGLRRGDVIIDQNASGKAMLTVVVRDIGDFPALRVGRVTSGMDGLICLVTTEDSRRVESSGLRAKFKATVKREEEAVYNVVFGMNL